MSIYNAIASPLDGPEITFPDSIDFIIEAMAPGIHIFDESGQKQAVPEVLEAPTEKNHLLLHL